MELFQTLQTSFRKVVASNDLPPHVPLEESEETPHSRSSVLGLAGGRVALAPAAEPAAATAMPAVSFKGLKLVSRLRARADMRDMDSFTRGPARRPTEQCIALPTDTWKMWWDMCMAVLILFSAVEVPIRLSFGLEATGWQWVLDCAISLAFLADVVVAFSTAHFENGIWVTSRAAISEKYMRGWFWIDAPSSVPVELIELALPSDHQDSGSLAAFRMLRMFRLLRLLRLLKIETYVRRMEERLEDYLDSDLRVLRIVKLIVKLLFLSHFLGCGWRALAAYGVSIDPTAATWLTEYNHGAAVDGPFTQQYLCVLLWDRSPRPLLQPADERVLESPF